MLQQKMEHQMLPAQHGVVNQAVEGGQDGLVASSNLQQRHQTARVNSYVQVVVGEHAGLDKGQILVLLNDKSLPTAVFVF